MTAPQTQIFDGLRVVDFSSGMAGPLASMMLADHGADVIKVEPANGEWARSMPAFLQWNRGKRSIQVDLHSPDGAAAARQLVLSADILIASDVAALLRLIAVDQASLDVENPALITCTIAGFASVGGTEQATRPMPTSKAYEGIVAAAIGRMTDLDQLSGGHPGKRYDEPAFTAAPVASYGASQLAIQGIVAALLQRTRTGRGQHVTTSLLQGSMAFVMRQELGRSTDGAPSKAILPSTHRGIELCFLTAECSDGRYIQMCARQDRHFHDWLRAVGLAHVLEEPRYAKAPMGIFTVGDVDELEVQLRERMRTKSQAEWMRVFIEDFDVGSDPFLTPAEFLHHSDMIDNARVVDIVDPIVGVIRELGPLVQLSATPAVIERSAPVLGATDVDPAAPWLAGRTELATLTVTGAGDDGLPPLNGVTILEVAYYIAGPLATAILAEMGARVIKVEPLEGDPYRRTGLQSAKFLHGKESLTLDLKHPVGRRSVDELIQRSDVVVHSFRANAAVKLGLDPAAVHARNPQAVHLYAASYGSKGPQRDRAAFHSTPNALTGGGIKQAGRRNSPVNDSYADPGSALGAATAILFGLWARHRTESAQAMETTMLASTGYIHSADMLDYDGAPPFVIADAEQRGLGSRYRLYRSSDGFIFVAALQPQEWAALLTVLDRRDLADVLDDDAIATALEQAFASAGSDHWEAALSAAGVGVTAVYGRTFDHWLEEHGLLTPMEHPLFGAYLRLPAKVGFSASAPAFGPACAAGEQSCDLLAELGFDQQQIDELIASNVTSDGRIKPTAE